MASLYSNPWQAPEFDFFESTYFAVSRAISGLQSI